MATYFPHTQWKNLLANIGPTHLRSDERFSLAESAEGFALIESQRD